MQCSYQLGGKIFDSGYQQLMHGGSSSNLGTNWHKDILDSWSPETPNSDIPRLNAFDQGYNNATSTRFLVSSNYSSINNITLGYTLPKRWTSKLGLEGLRV